MNTDKSTGSGGRLVRATDSEGHVDSYTYAEKSEMLTAGHDYGSAVVMNAYSDDGYIKSQTVADGGTFEFSYFRGQRNVIHEKPDFGLARDAYFFSSRTRWI
jgi:hypothetical protein